jgi:RND family efflux transporter MFP subunit
MRAPRGRRSRALLLAALALAGCAPRNSAPESSDKRAPVDVEVVVVGASESGAQLVLPGRVRAREEISLGARIAARLTALPRREGQRFKAGESLALFDAPETRSATAAATAAFGAAALRRDLAARQEARVESLFTLGVVAHRELEIAQSDRRSADAEWMAADAAAAEARSGATIAAPFDGVVIRRRVDVGERVLPGQPILDLRSDAPAEIEVQVPESDVAGLEQARISFQVDDTEWIPARLLRLDGMTDYATRTRTAHLAPAVGRGPEPGRYVRVAFSSGGAPASIRPGGRHAAAAGSESVRSRPSAGPATGSPALEVPLASLVRRGALVGVFVVADDRAELRWLRTGRAAGVSMEVLAGLWPGERIARDPGRLADGAPIRIRP